MQFEVVLYNKIREPHISVLGVHVLCGEFVTTVIRCCME